MGFDSPPRPRVPNYKLITKQANINDKEEATTKSRCFGFWSTYFFEQGHPFTPLNRLTISQASDSTFLLDFKLKFVIITKLTEHLVLSN